MATKKAFVELGELKPPSEEGFRISTALCLRDISPTDKSQDWMPERTSDHERSPRSVDQYFLNQPQDMKKNLSKIGA